MEIPVWVHMNGCPPVQIYRLFISKLGSKFLYIDLGQNFESSIVLKIAHPTLSALFAKYRIIYYTYCWLIIHSFFVFYCDAQMERTPNWLFFFSLSICCNMHNFFYYCFLLGSKDANTINFR